MFRDRVVYYMDIDVVLYLQIQMCTNIFVLELCKLWCILSVLWLARGVGNEYFVQARLC